MKKSEKKQKYNFKGIMIAGFLFFAIGASVLIITERQERSDLQEQAALDKKNMNDEQLALVNEIEQNLAEITAHEGLVRSNLSSPENEGPLSPEQRINQEIAIIADLIDQNNLLIADLQGQLSANDAELQAYADKNKRLERKLSQFNKQISELEDMNAFLVENGNKLMNKNLELTSQVELTNAELDSQFVKMSARQVEIVDLNKQLNESFYLVGNYKDLKDLDIVEKEGGIIGIGATKELKDNFNKDPFIQIDKSNYTTIPVFSKKAEVATNHPTDSYKWIEGEDEVKWLEITNPKEFWESSNYLVILTGREFSLSKSA